MLIDIKITEEEKKALEEYQSTYYKIINTLLRKGITSEETINSKKGNDYIPPTNEQLEEAIKCIKNIYSAIIKNTIANGNNIEDKPLYRGTQKSIIDQMMKKDETTSFLSATTNKNQTRTFSKTYSKDKSVDPEYDKAFLKVEGNVPHINLEELLGGMEDEIIFAPAKVEIIEGIEGISNDDEKHKNMYGKPYTLKLMPLEIPEMSAEEIVRLRESIFDRNEQMGKILNAIMQMKQFPNLSDPNSLNSITNKYSQWKEDFIRYCYQEFRIINKELGFDYFKKENIYQEQPENKTRTDNNPESFESSLRFEIPIDVQLEIAENNKKMQENFEKEVTENPEKKKTDPTEYGVR